MSDACRAVEEGIAALPGSRPNRQQSAGCECECCREQTRIDAILRGHFAELPAPALTPNFSRSLRVKLKAERQRKQVGRRWQRLLLAYWILAGLASAIIVARVPDPMAWIPDSRFLVPLMLLGASLPVIVMVRVLKKDPIELVFTTLEWFR